MTVTKIKKASASVQKRQPTQGQLHGLEVARQKLQQLGKTPADRQEEKFKLTLRWIHAWGTSSAEILKEVVGVSNQDWLTKMRQARLIKLERLLNKSLYLITREGVEMLKNSLPESHPLREVSQVRSPAFPTYEHDVLAQTIVLSLMRQNAISKLDWNAWASERELRIQYAGRTKIPDAVLRRQTKQLFIEVETTKKYKRELDMMLYGLVKLAKEENQQCMIFARPSVLPHYKVKHKQWLDKKTFTDWDKWEDGKWHPNEDMPLLEDELDGLENRIQFIEWPLPAPKNASPT